MSFILKFFILLGVWFLLYEQVIKPLEFYDNVVIHGISNQASGALNSVGFESESASYFGKETNDYVYIVGSQGVQIGAGCDGLTIISLFVIFIVAFPGVLVRKLWYIPLGATLLFYVNVVRVAILAWIMSENPERLAFNHDYTFTILVYLIVFALWFLWVSKISKSKKTSPTVSEIN